MGRIEYRQELVPFSNRAGAFRGDEVAEDLADDRQAIAPDALQRRLGVPREGAADAADIGGGLPRHQSSFAVTFCPQARHSKGEHGQRAALTFNFGNHLAWQLVVLECEPPPRRRLDERPEQRMRAGRLDRCERIEDRRQGFVVVAAEEKIVAQTQEDVDVGLSCETSDKLRKLSLSFRRVEGEKLFELVDDHEHLIVPLAPPGHQPCRRFPDIDKLSDGVNVVLEFRGQRSRQGRERRFAWLADQDAPSIRLRRDHTRAQQRALSDSRRPDHRQQPPRRELAPHLHHLGLAAEEELGVGFGEGGEAGVGAEIFVGIRARLGGELRNRARRPLHHRHRHHQSVAPPVDGLDEGRIPRVVTQRRTDLVDGVGEGVVGDELGRPHPVDDLEPRHHLARPLGQTHQHVHHLELELDRRAAAGDAVQRRFDEPLAKAEGRIQRGGRLGIAAHASPPVLGVTGDSGYTTIKTPSGDPPPRAAVAARRWAPPIRDG